jgi:hypothetical protein
MIEDFQTARRWLDFAVFIEESGVLSRLDKLDVILATELADALG